MQLGRRNHVPLVLDHRNSEDGVGPRGVGVVPRPRVRPIHGGEEDAVERFSFGLAGFFGEMGRRLEEVHLQDGTWGDGMDDGRQKINAVGRQSQ